MLQANDVEQAIEFAKEQNDHDLWEDLLKYSETRPRAFLLGILLLSRFERTTGFIRGLLENVGAEIDPVRLIRRIKDGLEIPGLKQALIKILQDFNLQVRYLPACCPALPRAAAVQISLMDGCESILFSDCRQLSLELQDGQASAFFGGRAFAAVRPSIPRDIENGTASIACHRCGKPAFTGAHPIRASTAKGMTIIFLCRHLYHLGCAFPDEQDFPPRPDHSAFGASQALLGNSTSTNNLTAKALDGRVRFSAELRSRTRTRCPACAAAPQRAV